VDVQEACEILVSGHRGDVVEFDSPLAGPCQLKRVKTGYRLVILNQPKREPVLLAAGRQQVNPDSGSQ